MEKNDFLIRLKYSPFPELKKYFSRDINVLCSTNKKKIAKKGPELFFNVIKFKEIYMIIKKYNLFFNKYQ